MDIHQFANNIAKFTQWCIIELLCNHKIRYGHYDNTKTLIVPKLTDAVNKYGSIDEAIIDLSFELIKEQKFKSQWNRISEQRTRWDEEIYYDELNKLFNQVIEWYGFCQVVHLHGDNYCDIKNKFEELINFDQNINFKL